MTAEQTIIARTPGRSGNLFRVAAAIGDKYSTSGSKSDASNSSNNSNNDNSNNDKNTKNAKNTNKNTINTTNSTNSSDTNSSNSSNSIHASDRRQAGEGRLRAVGEERTGSDG